MGVRAEIEFLLPGTERPFTYARERPPGAEPETARFAGHAVEICDVRGGEPLRLDEHGGTLGHWPTQLRRFDDEACLRERYYPESAEIIRAALGADRVVVFDHNVRRGGAAALPAGQSLAADPRAGARRAAQRIHGSAPFAGHAAREHRGAGARDLPVSEPVRRALSQDPINAGRAGAGTPRWFRWHRLPG